MKKTKLLPLFGLATVCATAIPLGLTSCNSSNMVNLMATYSPKIERAEAFSSTKSVDELTKWYFERLTNKPDIYKEDFYYAHSLYVGYLTSTKIVNMNSAKANISNISVDTITSSEGIVTYALSCDIKYNYAGYPGEQSGLPSEYLNLLIEGNFSFQLRNVPMRLIWYTAEQFISGWASQILVELDETTESYAIPAAYDNKWSITEDAKVNITDEYYEEGIYHKIVYPFATNVSAKTRKEFLDNIVGQNPITKLTVTDIVTSYYMSKMNEEGK